MPKTFCQRSFLVKAKGLKGARFLALFFDLVFLVFVLARLLTSRGSWMITCTYRVQLPKLSRGEKR